MFSSEGASSTSWTSLRDAISIFDGSNAAITQKWLEVIEGLFAPFPHHEGFRAAAARAKLSGQAAAVMANYIQLDWLEFKEHLLRHFDPKDARVATQLEIVNGTRYVGGSFMAALDRAVADYEFLDKAYAVSILSALARRVPESVLDNLRFSPGDEFTATIAVFRETAKKA